MGVLGRAWVITVREGAVLTADGTVCAEVLLPAAVDTVLIAHDPVADAADVWPDDEMDVCPVNPIQVDEDTCSVNED